MYKSKLQELCQRRGWDLPLYSTEKVGPGHMPRFTASVNVQGDVFTTPADCQSAKEAQNAAAQIAFDHFYVLPPQRHSPVNSPARNVVLSSTAAAFTPAKPISADTPPFPVFPLPSSLPIPSAGFFAAKNETSRRAASMERVQQNNKDTLHMYKNRLQQFAQKQNLGFPVYTCEAEGPPHARRFKSSVSLGGKSYGTPEYFTTLKEAEQASARIACQILSVDVIQEDGGLCKNLLQEVAQKKGLPIPSYETVTSGLSHRPIFISAVAIGSDTFRGAEAKTKKQAEMNAARVAYNALTEGCSVTESSQVSSINGRAIANNMTQNIQPIAMIKQDKEDTTIEEAQIAEKLKSAASGKMILNSDSAGPSHGHSSLGNPSTKSKIVVFPRKLNFPVPECAYIMPYSDDRWVAYKVPESTA